MWVKVGGSLGAVGETPVALLPNQGRQNKSTFVMDAEVLIWTERLVFMYQQVSFNILIKQVLIISDESSYKTKDQKI